MIFFFYGPNTYMARQQIAKLTAEYEKKNDGSFGLERIEGAKATEQEINAALQATPFLANSRLVIIESLGTNKTVASKIESLLTNVPSTTVAVFYDPQVDQRTTYYKTLQKLAKSVSFELLATNRLQSWINAEVIARGGDIERPAISRLLELVGDDQWRLSNEIAKLAAYATPITVKAVNEQVEERFTETVFTLIEAMTAGNAEQALQLYQKLRQSGQNEMYILSMVLWQLRNLVVAKAAGKITSAELAKAASMSPFVAGKMLAKRHLFSDQALKEAFLAAVDTDYQIKSGNSVAEVAVEQLIYQTAGRVTV